MARVKHPDTFTCDICGSEMDEEDVIRVSVPVMVRHVEQEDGELRLVERFLYDSRELDLCCECFDLVLLVDEVQQEGRAPRYEFIPERFKAGEVLHGYGLTRIVHDEEASAACGRPMSRCTLCGARIPDEGPDPYVCCPCCRSTVVLDE